ncbi:MAG: glycosyltransferase [Actinobacteria bacterium]|nr:glycosyltransferase [Actinomycetota bacterium]
MTLRSGPVRVIVLNYNGGEDTLRCFDRLMATDWPADELELICVDNGSVDGSVEALRTAFPQVQIRALGSNGGFPANNVALRDLDQVRYVALVNNDAFVEPGWLARWWRHSMPTRGSVPPVRSSCWHRPSPR